MQDEKTKECLCIYGKIKDVENAHSMQRNISEIVIKIFNT